jgi:hypothetical protein
MLQMKNPRLAVLALAAIASAITINSSANDLSAIKAKAQSVCPKDLDYLIGEWDAGSGEEGTDVKWEAPLGSCYLVETWAPRKSGQTSGYYFAVLAYDAKLKNWSYLAASPVGDRLRFENGVVKGNRVTLEQADLTDGTVHRFSYTKLPNDQVRELSMGSKDGGKTWTTDYDLVWKRKKR